MRRVKPLVIGAGPAGLAAAWALHRAGVDVEVVERAPAVGGLAKTRVYEEDGLSFRTDQGPHRFFSKNPELYRIVEELLGDDWVPVERHTRQYVEGRFYDYPIDAVQALRNLGVRRATRIMRDYGSARVRYGLLGRRVDSFADHIEASFGRALGDFHMIPYTEKIWGLSARELHPDWAAQRIKGLDLRTAAWDAFMGFVGSRGEGARSLVDSFYYPRLGTGQIYETMVDRLRDGGHAVTTSCEPTRIAHDGRRVTSVTLSDGRELAPSHVLESIPIGPMLRLLDPLPPDEVLRAAGRLSFRAQVYVFLTLDVDRVGPDQWTYFPDPEVPFARISEMKNFSEAMAPAGKSSLFVEYFCFPDDAVWDEPDEALVARTVTELQRLGFVQPEQVRRGYVLRQRSVYPIYDLGYPGRLRTVTDWLERLENLVPIGRPGRFRYNNQDHSLEMGLLGAKGVIDGKRYDLDAIGAEDAYQEAGEHPTER